jgi:hypothetical protein
MLPLLLGGELIVSCGLLERQLKILTAFNLDLKYGQCF